jgi:uncharacterized YccA/Bax inhibitor family protein
MATANPAMNEAVYRRAASTEMTAQVMTVEGTVLKTTVLMVILMITAVYSWSLATTSSPTPLASALPFAGAIGGFILALVTIFMPRYSAFTSPLYAGCEGLFLGGISAAFEASYHGIVIKAVGLSVGVLAMMLFVYGTGLIRATEKFKIGVVAATGAVALVYVVSMVMSLFGKQIPLIHESGMVGIGFSVVVVVIAALNLILDFDFIERGVQLRAPKYMEWYGGFSLMVTLVWMYLEILRLLSKLQGRSRS